MAVVLLLVGPVEASGTERVAELPFPNAYMGAAPAGDGSVVLWGGYSPEHSTTVPLGDQGAKFTTAYQGYVMRFWPENDTFTTWHVGADGPSHPAMALRGNDVLSAGGFIQFDSDAGTCGGNYTTCDAFLSRWDGTKHAWQFVAQIPKRGGAALWSDGTDLFLAGGVTPSGVSDDILRLEKGHMVPAGKLPHPWAFGAVATANRTAFLVGGWNGTTLLDDVVAVRGTQGSPVARLPSARSNSSAAVLGDELFVFGGQNATDVADDIIDLQLGSATVAPCGHLPEPSTGQAAAATAGAIYLFGGNSGTATRNVVWRFDGDCSPDAQGPDATETSDVSPDSSSPQGPTAGQRPASNVSMAALALVAGLAVVVGRRRVG